MTDRKLYRNRIDSGQTSFEVRVKETDLWIHAPRELENTAIERVFQCRGYIEAYIADHPEFVRTLVPWRLKAPAQRIIQEMVAAGQKAGVGPMAAVAGAIAEYVGNGLLLYTDEVIVENGGDIFIKKNHPVTVGIFAGRSPLSLRIGVKVSCVNQSYAVCTSSGTVGHSLSYGIADAVSVVSDSCSLADAAATAIGNCVKSVSDITAAIEFGKRIDGVRGVVIIAGNQIGAWGELELVRLSDT